MIVNCCLCQYVLAVMVVVVVCGSVLCYGRKSANEKAEKRTKRSNDRINPFFIKKRAKPCPRHVIPIAHMVTRSMNMG